MTPFPSRSRQILNALKIRGLLIEKACGIEFVRTQGELGEMNLAQLEFIRFCDLKPLEHPIEWKYRLK